jgi:hypothetical protein
MKFHSMEELKHIHYIGAARYLKRVVLAAVGGMAVVIGLMMAM